MRKKDRQRKKAIKRTLKRLDRSMRDRSAMQAFGQAMSEYIRAKLTQPNMTSYLIEVGGLCRLDPPYRLWAGEDNVVHWTGVDAQRFIRADGTAYVSERVVRFCDFREVVEDRSCEQDEVPTCLTCHANQAQRTRPSDV